MTSSRSGVRRASCEASSVVPTLSAKGEQKLLEYTWPGNVRELENVVYMALVEALPGAIIGGEIIDLAIESQSLQQKISNRVAEIDTLEDVKMRRVLKALQQCGGNQAKAARLLGISRQAVSRSVMKILARLDLK